MPVLTSELRAQLEKVIVAARDLAEEAARRALEKRGVDSAKAFDRASPEDKALRNQLRARGRQAGDRRRPDGSQEIDQVTQELAYEYWHRMLFARFLAENHLLMHPDGVSVSLDECNELAASEGAANGFVLAARYASRMLPQIFRTDDVLLEIEFPANDRLPLEKELAKLPSQTFTADDSLGWVYQFWQSKRKDEVNAKGDKIDARSISAVTQLFTEHYMVLFLLHNTVGAWHAGKVLAANPTLAVSAESEDELRSAVALDSAGGYTFEYLRFIKDESGTWRSAAGTFDGWPKTAAELKVLDPCCGSGHFLVAVFELLVRLRMAEQSISLQDAIDAVLSENLHGLELDPRCTQIAAFNLAMAAWKLGGYRVLPAMNIACPGRSPVASADDWLAAVSGEIAKLPLRDRDPVKLGLRHLHDLFAHGPMLGSLVDVESSRGIGAADWQTVQPFVEKAMHVEGNDFEMVEEGVTARGLATAARLLAGPDSGYSLVITNVPYLFRSKQDTVLQHWADTNEPDAKTDLSTMFISRGFKWIANGGSLAVVCPQNWLFLTRYRHLRTRLLNDYSWNVVARLGSGAFETIGGAVVNVALIVATRREPGDDHAMIGLDASTHSPAAGKAAFLRSNQADAMLLSQIDQKNNPDSRITVGGAGEAVRLDSAVIAMRGIVSGDGDLWIRVFWELDALGSRWRLQQSTVTRTQMFAGREHIIDWSTQGRGMLRPGTRNEAYGRQGVAVAQTGDLNVTLYSGELYDNNTGPLVPIEPENLPALWAFCESELFHDEVRVIDQALKVTNASFLRVPFDLSQWQAVAAEKYPNGLPEPESDEPTQWLFHGRPEASEQPLQVAVARLAGYRWPAELDETMRLSERARALVKRCDELAKFADDDGILPIGAMRGEKPLHERLTEILAATYGETWSSAILHKLLTDADMAAAASLDDWLRTKFFEQHCKLFHHRPFLWHIWDGRKDGFNVVVNYHKLDHKRLESLTHAYLGDWIATQASDAKADRPGAGLRLEAAQKLQTKLELILKGEAPYDIFVRWKALKDQPIGWHPDLNDGVRMNIRPFVEADVLRKKPNVKWTKDRGKDPATAPWFGVFQGERINDHHLSLKEKRDARSAQPKG